MVEKCKILDIFSTTLGTIAVLGFWESNVPSLGMILQDNMGNRWKVIGLALGQKDDLTRGYNDDFSSIWDCNLERVNHASPLIKQTRLGSV